MQKTLAFLRTKIGLAVLVAIVIVGLSLGLKYKNSTQSQAKGVASLIVEQIIKDSVRQINEAEQNPVFASSTAEIPTEKANDTTSYTATDRLSQEIFKEYMNAKQSNQEITADISSRIAETVLSQDYGQKTPMYSVIDMKISTDLSVTALKTYGNALGTIFSTPPAGSNNELQIFEKITTESVEKYQAELLAIKNRYISMRTKILALNVPSILASTQAEVANSLSVFIDAVDGAIAIDDDPIGSLGKIAAYDAGLENLEISLATIKKTFLAKGVKFSAQEKGFILTE